MGSTSARAPGRLRSRPTARPPAGRPGSPPPSPPARPPPPRRAPGENGEPGRGGGAPDVLGLVVDRVFLRYARRAEDGHRRPVDRVDGLEPRPELLRDQEDGARKVAVVWFENSLIFHVAV